MRSRYSAFVVRDEAYLLRTWSAANRPRRVQFDDDLRWTGLEILGRTGGRAFHTDGTVEFCAHFRATDSPVSSGRTARSPAWTEWVYERAVSER